MVRFLVEVVLNAGLVWYSTGNAVDSGGRDKFFPVIIVVGTRLVVECRRESMRVEQVEGVGGRKEVVKLLVFRVSQQRLAIVIVVGDRVVEEIVREGVCAGVSFVKAARKLRERGSSHTAKWRRVLVIHGGTRKASGRSTREPRERLVRQCRQLGGLEGVSLARKLGMEGGGLERGDKG